MGIKQLVPDGNCCVICGDNDHQAWECHHNPIVQSRKREKDVTRWRCYHCNEVFDDREEARKHFGNIPSATVRCVLLKCRCHECECGWGECAHKRN